MANSAVHPPRAGVESYASISRVKAEGAMYLLHQIHRPQKVIEVANAAQKAPDAWPPSPAATWAVPTAESATSGFIASTTAGARQGDSGLVWQGFTLH
jgi:hypothetical protein